MQACARRDPGGHHLRTPSERTGWEVQGTPSGKCQRDQVLLENLEMAGPGGPGSERPGSMELACVPCFTDESLFPDLLVSPVPLPTSFRLVKYTVTLHRAEKKADSQG